MDHTSHVSELWSARSGWVYRPQNTAHRSLDPQESFPVSAMLRHRAGHRYYTARFSIKPSIARLRLTKIRPQQKQMEEKTVCVPAVLDSITVVKFLLVRVLLSSKGRMLTSAAKNKHASLQLRKTQAAFCGYSGVSFRRELADPRAAIGCSYQGHKPLALLRGRWLMQTRPCSAGRVATEHGTVGRCSSK